MMLYGGHAELVPFVKLLVKGYATVAVVLFLVFVATLVGSARGRGR